MKKVFSLILILFLVLTLVACGKPAPPLNEVLVKVETWERFRIPSYTYTFKEGGRGYITNILEYSYTWRVSAENTIVLLVSDGWGDVVERPLKVISYTGQQIVALDHNDNEIILYPAGTQPKEVPKESTQPAELIGTWYASGDSNIRPLLLKEGTSNSGYYSNFGDGLYILIDTATWGVHNNLLHIFIDEGWQYIYTYSFDGTTLTLRDTFSTSVYTLQKGDPMPDYDF